MLLGFKGRRRYRTEKPFTDVRSPYSPSPEPAPRRSTRNPNRPPLREGQEHRSAKNRYSRLVSRRSSCLHRIHEIRRRRSANEDPIVQQSCRPDFSILVYPAISFTQDFAQSGSKEAPIGTDADRQMAKHYSSELHVDANTPPAILIHSADDEGGPYNNSVVYYEALQKHKVDSELVLYSYGGHGYGLATGQGRLSGWPDHCNEWLKSLS